ncbi:MAG: SEC-C domain-containing protein [Deltaproteobacteria bacterium]|nr:SEC-C domain-containing protein [Deltaproteobacteria bacterium]
MKRKPLSPNAKCPCGTGRKYKSCCFGKGFHFLVDEDGNISRDVPLHPEVEKLLPEIEKEFAQRHGRPMGPGDRIFDGIDVEDVTRKMVDAMRATGVAPAYIYAYEKTGLLLTEDNRHLMQTKDVEEFEAAMDEYDAEHGDDLDP